MDTASDDGLGDCPTPDAAGPAAYAAAGPASPASAATVAAGVTMATTRSRSPLIQGVRKTTPIPIPMSIKGNTKGKSKAKGKGQEADVRGGESMWGYQQQQQVARDSRREEDAASVTSSTSPNSPTSPPSSSPCPSPSSGPEKTAVVVDLREGDEAQSNDGGGHEGGNKGGDEGSGRWGGREGDDCNDEKEENIASDSKTPMAEAFFGGVAVDSRKCALGEEAGGGVAVRAASKRRRSVDAVMAMSAVSGF